MGRSWDRYDASLEDIKRCRRAIISQFPNATDIFYDEYLVDRHQNESCNANKFYYGAVMETKDGRFQAATSYGRIGDYTKAFGGIKAFNEGVFTNFDSAKRKLNDKLDKKKGGKVCRKCKTRQSYSPFAPKNAEEYGAEAMSPQVFGKLAGQYPQPPNNPLPVGGFMDEGFEWTVNQAETASHICPFCGKDFGVGNFRSRNAHMGYAHRDEYQSENEDYYCTKCDEGFSSITPTDEGQFCNNCLPDSATPHNEMEAEEDEIRYRLEVKYNEGDGWEQVGWIWKNEEEAISAYYDIRLEQPEVRLLEVDEDGDIEEIMSQRNFDLQKEEFGSSNIVSKVKDNWLNSLIGLGVGLVAFDFLKKKVYVANADTLIESPNTGDLTPADYEEIVVESTGYAVPIIPVSLDGSFMGSRFHALPTDRYVYDSPEGIGANIDVAMKRNTNFLPNEQSLVQASEAPGQSPYNSMQPNGQENTDFPLRVIHETTTVSLDPSTASFIPTDLSGYTGQQFVPTSVYEDMLGVGISGRIPSFSQPASGDIGSNHFGSRIANPDMLTNVGGPLKEDVNGDYTDGNITKSLSQWSIENQVQQISDTEAIVVERGSGGRKMIRRV